MKINLLNKAFKTTTALALVFSLAACSSNSSDDSKEETNEDTTETTGGPVTDLLNDGYTQGLSEDNEENDLRIEFYNEDYTDFKMVQVILTDEQREELDAIDFFADDYYEQVAAYLDQLDVTITDINDEIPSQEAFDECVGQPISYLTDAEEGAYEQTSFNKDSEGVEYIEYSNEYYTISVYPEGGTPALDEMSEDLGSLIIEKVGFLGFNDLYFED